MAKIKEIKDETPLGWKLANLLMIVVSTSATGIGTGIYVKSNVLAQRIEVMTRDIALVMQVVDQLKPMAWRERVMKLEMMHDVGISSHTHPHGKQGPSPFGVDKKGL